MIISKQRMTAITNSALIFPLDREIAEFVIQYNGLTLHMKETIFIESKNDKGVKPPPNSPKEIEIISILSFSTAFFWINSPMMAPNVELSSESNR